jgi:hypothetical protein
MTEELKKVNEGVRLIRWRMTHEKTRFIDELRIIPGKVFGILLTLFVIAQIVAQVVNHSFESDRAPYYAVLGVVTAAGLFISSIVLLFAYINRDAKRRGMNTTLWTLLAIFVPYLIGVVIYFLMREPLPFNCPNCNATVSARFNYCPSCKFDLLPSCPECRREVRAEDKFCPYCAHPLVEV